MTPPLLLQSVRFFSKRLPIVSGAGTLIQTAPFKWLRFADDPIWIVLSNGLKARVLPNDFIGKSAYFFGDHDPKIQRALASVLSPTTTLLDIGANIGTVSLGCAKLARRVIAIEPQPRCAALLRESIAANALTNVEVHEVALADREGTAQMFAEDTKNLGTMTLIGHGTATGLSVRTVNATQFLNGLKIDGDYVIKIDVEGLEDVVLGASEPYFQRHPPKAILFECNDGVQGDFFAQPVYRRLARLGYNLFAIQRKPFRFAMREVLPKEQPRAKDFLAVKAAWTTAIPAP